MKVVSGSHRVRFYFEEGDFLDIFIGSRDSLIDFEPYSLALDLSELDGANLPQELK